MNRRCAQGTLHVRRYRPGFGMTASHVPKLVLAVVEKAPLESHDRGKAKGKQRTLHGSRRPLAVFDARRQLLHFFRVTRDALGNPLVTAILDLPPDPVTCLLPCRRRESFGVVNGDSSAPPRHVRSEVSGVVEPPPLFLGCRPSKRDEKTVMQLEPVVRPVTDNR